MSVTVRKSVGHEVLPHHNRYITNITIGITPSSCRTTFSPLQFRTLGWSTAGY